ncbi:MAG: DUF4270 family protein [Bacteroidota bacterium]
MIRTQKIEVKKWRKVKLLSAAFFVLLGGLVACKKDGNPLGQSALPEGSGMNSDGVDTFQLFTYPVAEDTVISKNPNFNLLGSYNDQTFGEVEANFYTQLLLSGFSPDFGDLNTVAIDSCVLAFEYGGYYGPIRQQQFEVYALNEQLSADSAYTNASTATYNSQQLIPTNTNQNVITPSPETQTIVGSDTVNPQLRLPIDTLFARDLLNWAESAEDNNAFISNLPGIHVRVNNSAFPPGDGSILYLNATNPSSKLTVYYTQDGEQFEFDFLINSDAVNFNHVDFDRTGSDFEQALNDSTVGQNAYYAQAFVARAKIDFPSLKDLPDDIIIHEATLDVPVSYYPQSDFYPSAEVNVTSQIFENDPRKFVVNTGGEPVPFNQSTMSYRFNLRNYVQNVLSEDIQNNGVFISPRLFNTSVERIIFNGPNTMNKTPPRLNVVYTEL